MKTVRIVNGAVREIIPDYALPVEKFYSAAFCAQCVEAPDEVEQHWTYDPDSGTFSPPTDLEPGEPTDLEPSEPTDTEVLNTLLGVSE